MDVSAKKGGASVGVNAGTTSSESETTNNSSENTSREVFTIGTPLPAG